MTGLGVWALVDKIPWIGELVGNDLLTGSVYVLLVGGIVVAVIAFFGCIGAAREVKCMLLTVSPEEFARNDLTFVSRVACRCELPIENCHFLLSCIDCALFQYFIILFLLFVTMLIGGVLGYVFREKLLNTVDREMKSSLRLYGDRKSIRDAWDTTQSTVRI